MSSNQFLHPCMNKRYRIYRRNYSSVKESRNFQDEKGYLFDENKEEFPVRTFIIAPNGRRIINENQIHEYFNQNKEDFRDYRAFIINQFPNGKFRYSGIFLEFDIENEKVYFKSCEYYNVPCNIYKNLNINNIRSDIEASYNRKHNIKIHSFKKNNNDCNINNVDRSLNLINDELNNCFEIIRENYKFNNELKQSYEYMCKMISDFHLRSNIIKKNIRENSKL